MTNYEKIIKDMSVDKFRTMVISSGICPFEHNCQDCDFGREQQCELSGIIDKEWLESEVE